MTYPKLSPNDRAQIAYHLSILGAVYDEQGNFSEGKDCVRLRFRVLGRTVGVKQNI